MSSSNNWKKYGGINKLDKMNFLNVNSITTDKLTLREAYVGAFDICGNVVISENLSVDGNTKLNANLYIIQNLDISKNLVVDGNIIVNGNSTFTNSKSVFYNNVYLGPDEAQYFYGTPNGIGVNIQNPNATLDICGNRVEVFNVFSDLSSNRNIIARNMNHQGIVVSVDNSNSTIDFFNDASINNLNPYDGRIQYQKNGVIMIDVSDNTYVASKLSVSNRKDFVHVLHETAVIYDISNNTYAYNTYDISTANTGNAVSLIASDNSSNTFLNIITPDKNGLSIGGGAYPLDRNKAMGTIGLLDASSGLYTPTQNIVRGSSLIKYKTSLGINTHSPRIDNYVVDINGPIHLTNGEVTNVSSNNFEIKNIVFSRTNKDYGLAFGSPYDIIYSQSPGSYKQKVLYTIDGGKSWSESRIVDSFDQINHTTNLEDQDIEFYSGYIYNQNYSIIGGDSNYIFYSNNGGQNWNNITIANGNNSPVIGVYIGETGNIVTDYKRVIILYYNKFAIFDISLNGLNTDMSANNTITITTLVKNPDNTDNEFNHMHGYGKYVYMVGTKIFKYDIIVTEFVNSAEHVFPTDPGDSLVREYNSVYAYDDNYVIAVGNKIISYTKDGGTNWNDITINTPDLTIESITLQSVYILDPSYAMAVGNNGVIIYSIDGSITWKTVQNDVINSSGNGNRIVNSNYNLNAIVMQDINSFMVSTLVRQHSKQQYITGKTNIMYCFLPNLMNRVNNYVFDMSGNMGIDGDIRINNGTIMIKDTRESTSISSGALQIGGGVGIFGNTNIGGNIVINSSSQPVRFENGGALYLPYGGATIGGNLIINGDLHTYSNTISYGKTKYETDATFSSNTPTLRRQIGVTGRPITGSLVLENNGGLYISGNTYIGGEWLDVSNSITSNSLTTNSIAITGSGIIPVLNIQSGSAYIKTNLDIGNDVDIGNNLIVRNTSTVRGISTFDNTIYANGNVFFNIATSSTSVDSGAFVVSGGVGIGENLNINGITTIYNTLQSSSIDNGAFVVNGGVGIGKNIYIGGNSYTQGNAVITGNTNITGNIDIIGNTTINNNNNRALTIPNGGIYIGGTFPATSINTGALQIPFGGASINGNLFLGGNISVGGGGVSNGTTSGALVVSGGAGISGNTNIGGNLSVGGVYNLTGNINVAGIAKFNNVAESQDVNGGSLVVAGGAGIGKNINIGGRANIAGDTSIGNSAVNTSSTGISNGALVVKGGVGISGNTNIGGITIITNGTASNRIDQGALVVSGGVGIGGNVYINSSLNVNLGSNLTGNINLTGFANFNNETDSTTNDYGALIVKGGVAIKKAVNIGGLAKIDGIATINNLTEYTGTGTGAFIVTGGVNISKNSRFGAINTFNGGVTSNSSGTGSLVVTGGVGISENINVGGVANVTGVTTIGIDTTPTTGNVFVVKGGVSIRNVTTITSSNVYDGTAGSGALIVSGGVNIGGNSIYGSINTFNGNVISNDTSTGSLVVVGGVGIGGSINVGGNINVGGGVNIGGNSRFGGVNTFNGGVTSTGTTTGSLVVTGGVGISGSINVGGNINVGGDGIMNGITVINNTTGSTSTTSGALQVKGGLGVSGTVNAASFNVPSDYRIKENVTRLDDSFSVDKLEPIAYYNTLTKRDDIGFIAHKVQELYPYLVSGEKDSADYQTVNYIGLIGILVHEIQELKRTVDQLKNGR